MKKLIALLFAALLALMPALAEAPEPEATPDTDSIPKTELVPEPTVEAPQDTRDALPQTGLPEDDSPRFTGEAIELEIDGKRTSLNFDASTQYSSIAGGLVQASYFGYSEDGGMLYELYMVFPQTAQPGMVITPSYAALTGEDSSVVLIVSNMKTEEEVYYFSSLMDGSVYPEHSDFAIAIDDIAETDGATTFSGTLSASLVALDMATGELQATLEIAMTPFKFTIGGSDERHTEPLPTESPKDNDMRKT